MQNYHNGFLAGLYPHIVRLDPSQRGCDNLGLGYTQHGEQFLVKEAGNLGMAEFVGANLCDVIGVPACQPNIVTIDHLGVRRNVFGSRIESGRHSFLQSDLCEWQNVISKCGNTSTFSAVFAIDLILGNDDRHWDNWIVQEIVGASGEKSYRLRALDFSRSWPTSHPAQHPLNHNSINTWGATKYWEALGVQFDCNVFYQTCSTISSLPASWLRTKVLNQLDGVFLSADDVVKFSAWWEASLKGQVIEVINSLENGVWK